METVDEEAGPFPDLALAQATKVRPQATPNPTLRPLDEVHPSLARPHRFIEGSSPAPIQFQGNPNSNPEEGPLSIAGLRHLIDHGIGSEALSY